MSTVTENDLKEVKQLITDLAKNQAEQFEKLNEKVNDMRVDLATLKEGQNALNKRLDDVQLNLGKRLDDTQLSIGKRLDNLDFIARTVIGGVVLALIAGLAKLLYPNLMS
jgi:uncharacterized phage infection (PIP) family protein YhgE